MILGKEKSEEEVIEILEHGFAILKKHGLRAFPFTVRLAEELDAETYGVMPNLEPDGEMPAWEDWRLVWQGEEYPPKYKTYEEWLRRYSR